MPGCHILNDVKRWENLTRRCEQQTDTTDIASLMSLIHCYYGYTMVLVEQKQHDAVERNIALDGLNAHQGTGEPGIEAASNPASRRREGSC